MPVAILGATRVGIVTPRQLRNNRRYAILACAAVAAFLPGDAITLLLETVPLYLLYEVSILLASFFALRDAKRERSEAAAAGGTPPPGGASGPGVAAVPPAPSPPGVPASPQLHPRDPRRARPRRSLGDGARRPNAPGRRRR